MAGFQPEECLAWTGGQVIWGRPVACAGVFTDSRRPLAGGLFVALCGERFDGHDFVEQAGRAGAAGALVAWHRQEKALKAAVALAGGTPAFFLIAVHDTLAGLHSLARGYRRRWGGKVVAVTGSNGKTTTKEMIAACLRPQVAVAATERNYNNDVGLPLTLLACEPQHAVCVVEMGMRGLGQIARLAAVAEPDVGVITNVGPVHLEALGNLDNVAKAKGELVAALPGSGTAVLNGDDARVLALAQQARGPVLTFGIDGSADLQARQLALAPEESNYRLYLEGREVAHVKLGLPGRHNVMNSLAALAAVQAAGFDLAQAAPVLAGLAPLPMRLERIALPSGVVLINDAYNASPNSMRAALEMLSGENGGRHVAVLGDMLELGTDTKLWHQAVGRLVAETGVRFLVAVGAGGGIMADEAIRHGLSAAAVARYPDAASAAAAVPEWLQEADCVLVKASRGVRLEQVAVAVARKK